MEQNPVHWVELAAPIFHPTDVIHPKTHLSTIQMANVDLSQCYPDSVARSDS